MAAEKLGLGTEIRELKLGASFTNPRSTGFHTVRYDFKPASVDVNKSAVIDVGSNNQITVNVPHLDGAGTSQTVFKGSQKPYQKECVLIIDKITGEITLEKLTSNIQVKKTRSESNHKPITSLSNNDKLNPNNSSINSIDNNSKSSKSINKNRKDRSINNLIPKHSPLQASPAHLSPGYSKSPKRDHLPQKSPSASPLTQATLASLPMIGLDDFQPQQHSQPTINIEKSPNYSNGNPITTDNSIGILSDSSSSSASSDDSANDSSDSGSENNVTIIRNPANSAPKQKQATNKYKDSNSSDSDSDDDNGRKKTAPTTKPQNHNNHKLSMPDHLLNEDLRLSESGSDSD